MQLGQDYSAHTFEKELPFVFFLAYHAFKRREGIISHTYLAEQPKIGYLLAEKNENLTNLLTDL